MFSNICFLSDKQPPQHFTCNLLLLSCWKRPENISVLLAGFSTKLFLDEIIFSNFTRLLLWIHVQILFNMFANLWEFFLGGFVRLLLKNVKQRITSFLLYSETWLAHIPNSGHLQITGKTSKTGKKIVQILYKKPSK